MRKLIIILSLFICLSANAQRWKVPVLYGTSIVLAGIGDGLYDNGNKGLDHVFNSASICVMFVTPFVVDYNKKNWWAYGLSYAFIRFALFDASYNTTRGLPYDYIGNTDYLDRLWHKMSIQSLTFPKTMSLIVGVAIPFNIPKNEKNR